MGPLKKLKREMELVALSRGKCVPYGSKTMPMRRKDARNYLQHLQGWALAEDNILREFKFKNYLAGLKFTYSLGKAAEKENHHPDILVKWKRVRVTLTTHDIKGLSLNDFIMASKAEKIYRRFG